MRCVKVLKMMNKLSDKPKIAIIGPYPPPYGGISVHIQRMHRYLQKNNVKHTIYTKTRKKEPDLICVVSMTGWLLKCLFAARKDVLHFHNIDQKARALIGLMGFLGRKVILTIHGRCINMQIEHGNWLQKKIIVWALKNITTIIIVDPKDKDLIMSLGIDSAKIKYIPAFIPPSVREGEVAETPLKVWDFIDSHKPVISANASAITFYKDQDLYGIDMCIDLCVRLKRDYPKIGLVFCLSQIKNDDYFNKMKQKINEREIGNNFLFHTKQCQMYPIIMKSDLCVRPTNIDGYAVSVAEAIYFGIPTVASDVCLRPKETILFRNRDIDDFTSKVRSVIDNHKQHKDRLKTIDLRNSAEELLKIYEELAGKSIL